MNHVATRLLTLIHLLQARPSRKAGELARELGVSERSIHRYMGMLDEMGIPIYSERGPYGGFSLVRGYRLPQRGRPAVRPTRAGRGAFPGPWAGGHGNPGQPEHTPPCGSRLVRELLDRLEGHLCLVYTPKYDPEAHRAQALIRYMSTYGHAILGSFRIGIQADRPKWFSLINS